MGKDREVSLSEGPIGRIEYDELGNPVWRPFTTVRTEHTLNRILETDKLTVEDDDASRQLRHVSATKGYDPYNGGIVDRDGERPRKKDLRALSEWVKMKKRLESGG